MSARSWCFTINNYTETELEELKQLAYRYIIIGKEKGAEGTPHLQGYVEFRGPVRFSSMKKMMPRAHLEARRGTREEARDYCKKDNDFTELGDWSAGGQGRRTDLDKARTIAVEEGMRGVTRTCNLQEIKVAEKFLTYNEEPRDWKPEVTWIYGPTGTGKSKLARELTKDDDVYTKNDGTKWWDGYDAHNAVIIDDFRDGWWSLTEMLSLLDRYEKRIEYKGGHRQFLPRKIIITSAKAPKECYKGVGECIEQLLRRLDTVTELGNKVEGNTIASTCDNNGGVAPPAEPPHIGRGMEKNDNIAVLDDLWF